MRTEVPRRLDHEAFTSLKAVVADRKDGPELAASLDD